MCALFSLEILQAKAVKGLISMARCDHATCATHNKILKQKSLTKVLYCHSCIILQEEN